LLLHTIKVPPILLCCIVPKLYYTCSKVIKNLAFNSYSVHAKPFRNLTDVCYLKLNAVTEFENFHANDLLSRAA